MVSWWMVYTLVHSFVERPRKFLSFFNEILSWIWYTDVLLPFFVFRNCKAIKSTSQIPSERLSSTSLDIFRCHSHSWLSIQRDSHRLQDSLHVVVTSNIKDYTLMAFPQVTLRLLSVVTTLPHNTVRDLLWLFSCHHFSFGNYVHELELFLHSNISLCCVCYDNFFWQLPFQSHNYTTSETSTAVNLFSSPDWKL